MNLFKIMQGIRSLAQAGKIDYQGAIQYLNQLGVEMDGIVKQALDNVFKKGKARDPEFGDTVVKMQIDEQGIPFNPKTLTSIEEKRQGIGPWNMSGDQDFSTMVDAFKKGQKESKEGVESLFEETKGVNWKDTTSVVNPKAETFYDELVENAYKESEKTGQHVREIIEEKIDYKFTGDETMKEIIDIIDKKFFKADGGRIGYGIGGHVYYSGPAANSTYDSRASVQDFQNALRNVSGGSTYQQQADARKFARNRANEMLTEAFRSGNQQSLQNLYNQFGFNASAPGSHLFSRGTTSGTLNQITGLSAANRDRVLDQMAQRMMSYPIQGSSAPPKKSPLQLKIEKNKRIYDEYVKNNPGLPTAMSQTITGPKGGTLPPQGLPPYEQKALLDQLTMLTPEEAFAGETFDTLSDLDQYNFAQAFTQYQPQLRDPTYVSPHGVPGAREIFARRYGIKDGGRIGFQQGGWADDLTGQAAAIYQSMNLGGHSDATIQNTLKSLGYWDGDIGGGGGGGVENIINTQQSIIPGAGGDSRPIGPESYTQTWTSEGIPAAAQTLTEKQLANKAYWENQPWTSDMAANKAYWEQQPDIKKGWWDKTKDFFSGLGGSSKVRGELGTRLANQPRLPLPGAMASWSLSPFNEKSRNYNPNFVDQLNFLEMQDGMIGRDPNSGLLKYGPDSVLAGKNVISMFGSNDYEEALQNKIDWFENRIARGKKISWDNYQKALAEQTKTQELVQKRIEEQAKKDKGIVESLGITAADAATSGRGMDHTRGMTSRERGKAASGMGGGSRQAKSGSQKAGGSGRTDSGWGWAQGGPVGLATMFTRRR